MFVPCISDRESRYHQASVVAIQPRLSILSLSYTNVTGRVCWLVGGGGICGCFGFRGNDGDYALLLVTIVLSTAINMLLLIPLPTLYPNLSS